MGIRINEQGHTYWLTEVADGNLKLITPAGDKLAPEDVAYAVEPGAGLDVLLDEIEATARDIVFRAMLRAAPRDRGPYALYLGCAPFTAELDTGVTAEFATVVEAREWAEAHGRLASRCYIRGRDGATYAEHRRDRSGDGMAWYDSNLENS